jgi:hypothetical protein
VVVALTTAEFAQLASTAFAALAAFAALLTVIRAERDRWDRRLPDFQVEPLRDMVADEARLTIVNYGGPAREVQIAGVEGEFGYFGVVPPTGQWRSGESRTITLSMPAWSTSDLEANTIIIARDLRLRYIVATTAGGNRERWKIRKRTKMSAERVFAHFFPGTPGPVDVPKSPVHMALADRAW